MHENRTRKHAESKIQTGPWSRKKNSTTPMYILRFFFQIMDQPGEFMTLVTAAFPSSRSVCFDQMLHGWVNRGAEDPMVPQAAGVESVSEAQASALKLAAEFLQAHGAS